VRLQEEEALRNYREAAALCLRAKEMGADVVESDLLRAKLVYNEGKITKDSDPRGALKFDIAAIDILSDLATRVQGTPRALEIDARRGLLLAPNGQAMRAMGLFDDASRSIEQAVQLLEDEVRRGADGDSVKNALAWAYDYRTDLNQRLALETALSSGGKEVALRRQLANEQPEDAYRKKDLANSLVVAACPALLAGKTDEARSELEEARAIQEALVRVDSSQNNWAIILADSRMLLCRGARLTGESRRARTECVAALEARDELAKRLPDAAGIQDDLADALADLGDLDLDESRFESARALYRRAASARTEAEPEGLSDLCGPRREVHMRLARAELALGRTDDAATDALAGLLAAERHRQAVPKDGQLIEQLAEEMLVQGDVAVVARDASAARDAFTRAHDECAAIPAGFRGAVGVKLHCAEAATKLARVVDDSRAAQELRTEARLLVADLPQGAKRGAWLRDITP
jgi:hypothetical protein